MLIGGLVGLLATAVTYVLAQEIIDAVGDGGLRLQAITGVLAIAVLLVVTNWFFHKVYWSEWIGRLHRRRKMLETAVILGVAFGLGATAIVGTATFALERKLPYKKMLIATGILIGIVLAVMTGVTVQNLQGLGWIPTTPIGIDLSLSWGRWLGVYPNWEGVGAQLAALLVVYGSYALARTMQVRRRRQAIRRAQLSEAAAQPPRALV